MAHEISIAGILVLYDITVDLGESRFTFALHDNGAITLDHDHPASLSGNQFVGNYELSRFAAVIQDLSRRQIEALDASRRDRVKKHELTQIQCEDMLQQYVAFLADTALAPRPSLKSFVATHLRKLEGKA